MLTGNKHWVKIEEFRKRYKIIFTLIGVVGVILIWRGVWTIVDTLPYANDPLFSLILGLLLVVISGIFFRLV